MRFIPVRLYENGRDFHGDNPTAAGKQHDANFHGINSNHILRRRPSFINKQGSIHFANIPFLYFTDIKAVCFISIHRASGFLYKWMCSNIRLFHDKILRFKIAVISAIFCCKPQYAIVWVGNAERVVRGISLAPDHFFKGRVFKHFHGPL